MQRAPLCLLTCDDARDLGEGIAADLRVTLTPGHEVWFPVGEAKYVIDSRLRGNDVYILQRTIVPGGAHSLYDNFLMALHAADAARIADADRVTLVLPYLPGTRQDKRKEHAREGISTGLFARMIEAAGVSMVITVEPHTDAVIGCYDPRRCVLESVDITRPFGRYLREQGLVGEVVASPDVGGLQQARDYGNYLKCDLAALSKERDYSKTSVVTHTTVLGEVRGRDVLLVDDIVDTGGSVVSAAEALWEAGAAGILVAAAHPVFSDPAWQRMHQLAERARERGVRFAVAGTDSILHPNAPAFYRDFSLVSLLANVIRQVNTRGSVRAMERP
ncbi:MAG: ribose-phosphate diphosphokinase [Deltaproteobacteria bacterium]|nr:ribose-phosphate diphosphokinase [Deltaproteobacteria bacterium]